jgi:hypothetical protein
VIILLHDITQQDAKAVMLLTDVFDIPGSDLSLDINCTDLAFCGFVHPLHEFWDKAGNRPQLLPVPILNAIFLSF